jgi:hypothetical protein
MSLNKGGDWGWCGWEMVFFVWGVDIEIWGGQVRRGSECRGGKF